MPSIRLGVLVSGSGTILEALIEAGVEVAVVGADRPCRGLEVAETAGIEAILVDRMAWGGFGPHFDRAGYSSALAEELVARRVDLVAMAGFGTVLAESFHAAFPGRVLTTHPSLLPAFKGWHAVAQALEAGVERTGCTVHVATRDLDDGPVLAQEEVSVQPGDDEATLHERIKRVERRLYPEVVARVMAGLREGREPGVPAPAREEG